ncbi:MAG: hypothetical protein NTU43_03765 [Bacteroidetes bacterium]|nr:hypothetical protein [Bacteroidota bacterium]
MYQTKIKLSNITNLSDARYAAAMGIDYIGFCFNTNDVNYIPPIKAKEIFEWTSGSLVVAEFGNQTFVEINDISELLNIDLLEINNQWRPNELTTLNKPIIKKIDLTANDCESLKNEIEKYAQVVFAFHLFSTSKVELSDFSCLIELCHKNKIIWGLPLNASNTQHVLSTYHPFALNISGGMEEKPGIKDFDEMNDWLESIEVLD